MTLFLKNATFIDWETLAFRKSHIAVSASGPETLRFIENLPSSDSLAAEDRILDCTGRLVTRSFGCGHHHIYSALARGMPAPEKIPENFSEILTYIWWRLDKLLETDMIEASALVSALYCAKNGVTMVIDHHASPHAVENSLSTIAKAFDRVGISHLLCYEMSDRDGEASREKALAETEAYLKDGGKGHVGLHASFTVGDELLQRAVDLASTCNAGIHAHVAEDGVDQKRCQEDHGKTVVGRYADAGVLDLSGSIFAHCIHLSPEEIKLVANAPVWVVQNTESNLNNNVGVADYSLFGDRILLGTDGMHSDMLRSAKASFLTGQAAEGAGMDTIYNRFRNIHRYVDRYGFEGDGENNLVILDYDAPTEINEGNFLGHFIYGIDSRHVESVIANGRLIVENRRLTTVDEGEILGIAREMADKLWRKMGG